MKVSCVFCVIAGLIQNGFVQVQSTRRSPPPDEQKNNQNVIEWHTRCVSARMSVFCECVRKKWARWAGVCCTVPHSRNTGSFFLHFFCISVDFEMFFFLSFFFSSPRISFQVILLLNCIFDRCVVFFPVVILFVTVQLAKIQIISFRFEYHYNVCGHGNSIFTWSLAMHSRNHHWAKVYVYSSSVCMHSLVIQMPHVLSILKWEVEHGNRVCVRCHTIFFLEFRNGKSSFAFQCNERRIQYPVDFGFSEHVKLKARVCSAHSIQQLIYRIYENYWRRSIKAKIILRFDLTAIRRAHSSQHSLRGTCYVAAAANAM